MTGGIRQTNELVKRIEKRLIDLDIRKLEFYRDAGLANSTISNWRNCNYKATPYQIEKVAQHLGITPEELTEGLT